MHSRGIAGRSAGRQPDTFRQQEQNNAAEKTTATVTEQNACNTSALRSKLKLVNTLKRKVFKKADSPSCFFGTLCWRVCLLMLLQGCREQLRQGWWEQAGRLSGSSGRFVGERCCTSRSCCICLESQIQEVSANVGCVWGLVDPRMVHDYTILSPADQHTHTGRFYDSERDLKLNCFLLFMYRSCFCQPQSHA